MKIEIPASWYEAVDKLDDGITVGAGIPTSYGALEHASLKAVPRSDDSKVAFCQFVSFARRERGISLEVLAAEADIDLAELVTIEQRDPHFKPDMRSVYQLANYFSVSRPRLMALAGLATPRNDNVVEQALKFAARSASVATLSEDERVIFEGYVSLLNEKAKIGGE